VTSTQPTAADGIRIRFWIWTALVTALLTSFAFVVLPKLDIETDIVALLPSVQDDAAADRAVDQFSQALARKVIFLVGAPQLDAAKADAAKVAAALRGSHAFSEVTLEISGTSAQLLNLYRAHRGSLASTRQLALLRAGDDERLLRDTLRAAFTPAGLTRPLSLVDDPLGLASDWLQQQVPALGAAQLDGSVLVVSDQTTRYVLIVAELAGSPFASDTEEAATTAIASCRNALSPGSELLVSGTVQHASAIASRAQNELATFGTIETAAVVALLLAVFGAMRPLALGAVTMGLAFVAGMTTTQLLFSKVHILALVFGSSLIGGVIDYSIHFFADRFRNTAAWTTRDAYEHVGGAILLGLTTTLLGYLVLLLMPFPGLRQIATFCLAGLIAGCGTVLCWYPVFYKPPEKSPTLGPRTGAYLTGRFSAWRWTPFHIACVLAVSGAAIAGIARVDLQDDVRTLQSSPAALVAEERRVAALLQTALESRYFLVRGANEQALLETEERLTTALDGLIAAGKLGNYTAVTHALPSYRRQRESSELLQSHVFGPQGLQTRAWAALGLPADAIARRAAASAELAPLSPEEWLASPASESYRTLWLGAVAGQYASIVTLGSIKDIDALHEVARSVDGVDLIDRIAAISQVLHTYRVAIGWLLVVVYLIAGVVLSRRFGWREVPSLLLPSAAASLVTLGLFGWFGVPVNLFTLLALWLVLGLGVDYGIFLRHGRTALGTAVLSVTLSALTTLLAFGLLAFSATPFIRSIGLTLLISITLSWLYAMLSCVPGAPRNV